LPPEAEAPIRDLVDRVLATVAAAGRAAESNYKTSLSSPAHPATSTSVASTFVIVSALAEGADRMVAEAGRDARFALEVVLPFHRAEYVNDFETPASKTHYQELLGAASAVFELDGNPNDRPRAYEAAGFVMLANIDLLIAIWDGAEAAGIGGTAQIVGRAIADGIPVVWIDVAHPDKMKLSWPTAGEVPPANARPVDTFRTAGQPELAKTIGEILAPPRQPEALESLKRFLTEREQRWNFCPWYPLLLGFYRIRGVSRGDFQLQPALADSEKEWGDYLTTLPEDRSQRPAIKQILLPAFAAPDHLAIYYSHLYRSGYVHNFLFAAIAVALALGGIFAPAPDIKSVLVTVELAVIVAILVTWRIGHVQQWHRRWLDYRRLAECVRQLRIFAPIGSRGSVDRPRHSLDTEEDWVNWYAWSLRRQLPLPDRVVNDEYLKRLRNAVRSAEIKGQINYHERNAARMNKLDHRLHRSAQIVLAATAALCVVFVGLVWFGMLPHVAPEGQEFILHTVTFLTALLPTVGAALGAIHVQGDFKTLAEQSERTGKRLSKIDKMLEKEQPSFALLADRIEKTSDVLMSDLREWQTVFRTRPLSPPA
jgi:hypothetical protein